MDELDPLAVTDCGPTAGTAPLLLRTPGRAERNADFDVGANFHSGSRTRVGWTRPVVLSHATAAVLHGLGDVAADVHEFTLIRRKQTREPHVRLHRRAQEPVWTVVDGFPVTTMLQTIADLAADHIDGGHLGGVVRDAVVLHYLPLNRLLPVLGRATRLYWGAQSDGRECLQIMLHNAGVLDTLFDIVELMAETTGWRPPAA